MPNLDPIALKERQREDVTAPIGAALILARAGVRVDRANTGDQKIRISTMPG